MAYQIELTPLMRINMAGLVANKEVPKGNFGQLEMLYDLQQKLDLGESTRKRVVQTAPNGVVLLDTAQLALVPNEVISFEKAEISEMLEILDNGQYRPSDGGWVIPLRKLLRDAKDGVTKKRSKVQEISTEEIPSNT